MHWTSKRNKNFDTSHPVGISKCLKELRSTDIRTETLTSNPFIGAIPKCLINGFFSKHESTTWTSVCRQQISIVHIDATRTSIRDTFNTEVTTDPLLLLLLKEDMVWGLRHLHNTKEHVLIQMIIIESIHASRLTCSHTILVTVPPCANAHAHVSPRTGL